MIWIIFIFWILFAVTCAIMEQKTNESSWLILFFMSTLVMFYVPFMV